MRPDPKLLLVMMMSLFVALGTGAKPVFASNEATFRIVALGDSLTAGYGLAADDAFPTQLQRSLEACGLEVDVVNAGVSGDTSSGGLARLDWAVGADADAVIVELGANDALRGVAPDVTEAALIEIVEQLQARDLPVLLSGMRAPPNLGRDYESHFNSIYPRLAESREVLFHPFFLDGVAARADLNQPDGMHPNAQGVSVIVQGILPKVLELIGAVCPGAGVN